MKGAQRKNGITKKVFIGLVVCFALMFCVAQVQAKDLLMSEWWHSRKQATTLGLTNAQITALDGLYANNYGPISNLKSTLKGNRQTLKSMFEHKPLNTQDLISQLNSIEATREHLSQARLAYIEGMIKILTPHQIQQLNNMIKKRYGKAGQGSWCDEQ
jgi:Spy/CpxP family protein refolding chaperone